MSKAIPLCPALCIQRVEVVVSQTFHQGLDLMLELLAMESWNFRDAQRKTVAIGSTSSS